MAPKKKAALMIVVCRDRNGSQTIEATQEWLQRTFNAKQVKALKNGKMVRKGTTLKKRRAYWRELKLTRKRL
jgi:hypothetical protein